jgi:flagellar motility protein MotE (MotC chaperone)
VKFTNPITVVRRYIRLLPAVLALGTVVLVVKGAGLVMVAEAQEQPAPAQPAPQASSSTAEQAVQSTAGTDADDDAETSSAQVDVLTSLAKRRAELDARERDLDMRDNLIAAAEKRVDGKIDTLKQLQSSIQALLVQRDAAEQKQLDALVKTYSNMKPKDAARIFDSLDENVSLAVAAQMKPDVLAPIIGAMQSEAAEKLTVRLANRLKVTEQQQAAAQLAQAMPAAAPTTATPPPAAATPAPTPANTPPPNMPAPQAQPGPAAATPQPTK